MPLVRNGDRRVQKTFTLKPELAERIWDYRFANRIRTESEAIGQLLEAGLGTINDCEDCKARPKLRGYRVCAECWGDRPASDVIDAKTA